MRLISPKSLRCRAHLRGTPGRTAGRGRHRDLHPEGPRARVEGMEFGEEMPVLTDMVVDWDGRVKQAFPTKCREGRVRQSARRAPAGSVDAALRAGTQDATRATPRRPSPTTA